jgi:hypothetical protein
MGQILGIGTTHYPGAVARPRTCRALSGRSWRIGSAGEVPRPRQLASPDAREYGGTTARLPATPPGAQSHFKRAGELDRFNPDVVIIFGDDQYENFKEGDHPALLRAGVRDRLPLRPRTGAERWGEGPETEFRIRDTEAASTDAAADRAEHRRPTPTSRPPELSHAFANTILFSIGSAEAGRGL